MEDREKEKNQNGTSERRRQTVEQGIEEGEKGQVIQTLKCLSLQLWGTGLPTSAGRKVQFTSINLKRKIGVWRKGKRNQDREGLADVNTPRQHRLMSTLWKKIQD